MDATKLQEIEARANAATPGPWYAGNGHPYVTTERMGFGIVVARALEGNDCTFIAHARTDVPVLIAEVRRLTAALATARREGAEEVMAMSSPWPLHDVLAKLTEASRALLNRYNYDGHGWEQILAACDSADAIIARIHARALPLDAPGGGS